MLNRRTSRRHEKFKQYEVTNSVQTVKMLRGANNQSNSFCTSVSNANTNFGIGGICILDIKQPEREYNVCKYFVKRKVTSAEVLGFPSVN